MVIIQYPHKLMANIVTGSIQDTNGNPVPGATETIELTCRAEPNGSGRMIQLANGQNIVYNWIVYMPKGAAVLADGAKVSITQDGRQIAKGQVLRFSKGQLDARLWL
ncbi:hypothetical protein EGT74_24525 [Chitinophaga lutea]|uniref:Uncharacterized protein n=1 Tax=Chitinophaga lutea TaxID=2488634 RepID=A0A3N4PA81_9BACT|nr:hypothetical protein [Chitinophaga lutea]RPE05552.1 hypothetical protein EGT74_24525 [Chitinophaga lutea]